MGVWPQKTLIVVVVLVLLAAAGIGYYFYKNSQVPEGARGMVVLAGSPIPNELYRYEEDKKAFSALTVPDGYVAFTGFARGGDREFAVLETQSGSYHIIDLATGEVLLEKTSYIAGLESSSTGAELAYALYSPLVVDSSAEKAVFSTLLSDWQVEVMDVESKQTQAVGSGYGPQFFGEKDPYLLLFVREGALVTYDLQSRETEATEFSLAQSTEVDVRIASDGNTLSAYDLEANLARVFAIDIVRPFRIGYLHTLPESVRSVVMKDGALYGVKSADTTRMLWTGSLENPTGTTGYLFPETFIPSRLIP